MKHFEVDANTKEADFDEAIRINPEFTEAHLNRANAHQKKTEWILMK